MESGVIYNLRTNQIIGDCVWKANSFFSRLRGLQGRTALKPGEGLWLVPCQQVHMFGMRYAISVWFLDKHGTICDILNELRPFQISPCYKDALSVIEFPVDWAKINDTQIGDTVIWKPTRADI